MGFSVVIHGMNGVTEMEDDTPGITAWPKFIATCTRVTRKQRGRCMPRREQNEYKAFHLIQFFAG